RDERTFERFAADLFLDPFREIVYDVGRTLGAFESAFGREAIELHVYDDVVNGKGDILGHFWKDVLGSPEKATLKKRANQSFHPAATELLRICNLRGYSNQFLFRDNPEWKAFLEALREIAPRHQRTITVDYGTVFGEVERRVLDRWQDRIVGHRPGDVLFKERSATLAYMDPDLWYREPALFDRLRTLLAGLPAMKAPERRPQDGSSEA
ncbi:MAG TPA: hypothetical protein PKA74_12310, partial [Bauldia sp.]|nr:hypothetical protein [Bauldia sp.]